ncbi:MAG: hypothetical protein HN341_11990 [Verrucomicrobia bacterium]|jgi:hypothetical protein|nr:hypothetical protein [Verrucomicrobiota bacterium]
MADTLLSVDPTSPLQEQDHPQPDDAPEHDRETTQKDDRIWKAIVTPGRAYQVCLELVNPSGEDALQRAVLGLLRLHPSTGTSAERIAQDLGLSEGITNRVLTALADMQVLVEEDGLYQEAKREDGDGGTVSTVTGWVVWDCYRGDLLRTILADSPMQRLRKHLNLQERRLSVPFPRRDLPRREELRRALLRATASDECRLFSLRDSEFVELQDVVVRTVSLLEEERPFPLLVPVEVRPRVGETAGLFFHETQLAEAEFPVADFCAQMAQIIESRQPDSLRELTEEAMAVNNRWLADRGAEMLAEYGGEERVRADARQARKEMLRGVSLDEAFADQELFGSAEDAEVDFILHQNGAMDAAPVRFAFERVLQILGRIVGDQAAKLLWSEGAARAINRLITSQEDWSNSRRRKWAQDREARTCRALGLSLGDFRMRTYLSELKNVRGALRDGAQRHQLRIAFALWMLPLFMEPEKPEVAGHIADVRSCLEAFPNFPDVLNITVEQRNADKSNRLSEVDATLPLRELRSNIYRIWKTVGARGHRSTDEGGE